MSDAAREEIRQVVLDYLRGYDDSPPPEPGEDLFATGRVNSLFAIQLVTFLESRFRVTVTVDDLDLANFSTLDRIADFVIRKTAGATAGA